MASITRKAVAAEVHESLDRLGINFSPDADGDRAEGDYTNPITKTLRDCAWDAISDADTHAKIRAVVRGTEYYGLSRAYRRRASEVTSQQGAGASGMHLAFDPSTALGSLRLHLNEVAEKYEMALAAIGIHLDVDPDGTSGIAQVVLIEDDDAASGVLVDQTYGLPWFREGYHEWTPS